MSAAPHVVEKVSSLPAPDPFREVLDDLRTELSNRRAQVLGVVTYLVVGAGALFMFSSIGEDSRQWYDTVPRTTLAWAGIAILVVAILLGVVTLLVDTNVRRRTRKYGRLHPLASRRRVMAAMAVAAALIALGLYALATWGPAPTQPEAPPEPGVGTDSHRSTLE
jgi:hypothetical protein